MNVTERQARARFKVFLFKLVSYEILFQIYVTPGFFSNFCLKWNQDSPPSPPSWPHFSHWYYAPLMLTLFTLSQTNEVDHC